MKKLIVTTLLACLNVLHADTVYFGWRANTEPDLAGYILRTGPEIGMPVNTYTLTDTHANIQMPPHHLAWLTAMNTAGIESFPAGPLEYKPVIVNVYVLESPVFDFSKTPIAVLEGFRADVTVFPLLVPPTLSISPGVLHVGYGARTWDIPVMTGTGKNFYISFVASRAL
jgi:hypothetical protein